MTKAKIIVCTPGISSKVSEAVQKSETAMKIGAKIICLGEGEGHLDLYQLMQDVNEIDIPEPVSILYPDKEKMMIFWSSGTSGFKALTKYQYLIMGQRNAIMPCFR